MKRNKKFEKASFQTLASFLWAAFLCAAVFPPAVNAQAEADSESKPAVRSAAASAGRTASTGQETSSGKVRETDADDSSEPNLKPAMAKYRKAQRLFKEKMTEVKQLQLKFVAPGTDEEGKEEIGEQLQEYAEIIERLHPKLLDFAEDAWNEEPSKDPEMLRTIIEVLEIRVLMEEYERAAVILRGLVDQNILELLPELYDLAGEVAFMMNDFEQAGRFWDLAEQKKTLSARCGELKKDIQYYRTAWAKESSLRERDSESKDLPRVCLTTTQGEIVLELFEDEAPNTVANFVYLVEKGFYDNLYFDSVVSGLWAEAGTSMETPDGGPGYTIRDEFHETDTRMHCRGTISMVKAGPDKAGSKFFISFTPMRQLDGNYVVFGRVVKGMDVLTKLQRIDAANPDPMAEPDQITEAEVLRKRDHAYRPKVLKTVSKDEEDEDSSKSKKEKKKSKKGKSAY